METTIVRDRHGVDVARRSWPRSAPAATVVLSHGASEHSGRYHRFACSLVDAGFAVRALDHRGHGATGATTGAGMLGPGGGEALIDDLDELVDEAVATHPRAPVVLFGHSMGSTIALAYATRHASRLAALVLCGFPSAVEGSEGVRAVFEEAVAAGQGDAPIGGGFDPFNSPFEPARTPFDWLSRDAAEVDRYLADERCGSNAPLTYGFVLGLLDVTGPALERASLERVTCPTFVIAGAHDPAAGMGSFAIALAEALRVAGVDVDHRLYEGARHELLNETNRDEVTDDIVRWIRGHIR